MESNLEILKDQTVGIIVCMILVGIFFIGLWMTEANAEIDRLELADLKQKVGEAEVEFKKINREIIALKIEQRDLKHKLSEQIKILENTKLEAEQNWDAIPQIPIMEESIENIETQIDENNLTLAELEEERNKYSDITIALKEQYEADQKQFRIENTFDPSGYTKLIGVKLSKTCQELIKSDDVEDKTTCPTYRQLSTIDSSLKEYSGGWGMRDGMFQRVESDYKNTHRAYDHDPMLRVIVDPPADQQERIKMITIENNFHVYFELEDRLVVNNTRTFQEFRFVDNCRNAVINSGNWTSLLPDTINYLRTGCTQTLFNDTKTVQMNSTEWNPADSPGFQYRLWVEEAMKNCLGLC